MPRYGDSEDSPLGEVPCDMDADGEPKTPGQLEGARQEHTCSDDDRQRSYKGSIGTNEMKHAKDSRRNQQCDPCAERLLRNPEQDPPEYDFLKRANDHGNSQRQNSLRPFSCSG